jgi:transposase
MTAPKLGIDISKKTFDVALIRDPETMKVKQRQFSNTPDGFQACKPGLPNKA